MEMMRFKSIGEPFSYEDGFVLPLVAILGLILAVSGIAYLSLVTYEVKSVRNKVRRSQTFYVAEAGIRYGMLRLRMFLNTNPDSVTQADLDAIAPPNIGGYIFDEFRIEKQGSDTLKVVEGLTAVTQAYKITCQARAADSTSSVTKAVKVKLVQRVEDQIFHSFQFGVFYNQDLELQPGPSMTFTGRIHSNKDIYLDCGATLSIDGYLTSAKGIYKGSKPGDPNHEGGTVRIKDANGVYHVMDFDSGDPDWAAKADSVWGGRVQSQAHGIKELTLPIPTPEDPHQIIERVNPSDPLALKEKKFHYQADLSIIDGVAYDHNGNVVDLTYVSGGDTLNPIDLSKSLFDHREGAWIDLVEVDIGKLIASGHSPANGILYISQSGSHKAVRLVNGSQLPTGGLTVATDNPVYIQGDYNTVNKQPASVLCDALNILSNSWDEQNDNDAGWALRNASATEVNASIMTGFTRDTSEEHGYSGGLENLFRFLENWNGIEFTYSGSITSLWYSRRATGDWKYGEPYYTAPRRNWSYDQDLLNPANLPPGTPELRVLRKINWHQEF